MEVKQNNWKVPWSGRGHDFTQEEIAVVVEAMNNADPLTQGRYQVEFEKKFASKFGLKSAFAINTCASALELSAVLCRIKPGDEVIIPAHTFAVSAIPFARRGAKIKWADIDSNTFLASRKTIEPLVTSKTKAIVVVHLYGAACEMTPIMELAKAKNILVVEDVAQAIGAKHNNQFVGSFGDLSCFSFHTHKNMTTLGEGGMLSVRSPDLQKVTPGFRHNGMRPFTNQEEYWKPAMTNVDFDWENEWPYNYCIGEVQCALGAKLLDRFESMNEKRVTRAVRFKSELSAYSEMKFQEVPNGSTTISHLMPARYSGENFGKSRDDLMKLLAFEFGIKMAVQYLPLYRYDMFKRAGFAEAHCPETDYYFDRMVSFPFHYGMSDDQFEYMLDSTKKALRMLRG
jgi:perosamine synthetase